MENGNGELIYYQKPHPDVGNKNGRILGQIVRMVMYNSWTRGSFPRTDILSHKSRGGAEVASQNINFCLMDAWGEGFQGYCSIKSGKISFAFKAIIVLLQDFDEINERG